MTTKERKEYEKRKKLKGTAGASNKQLGVKGFDEEDSDEEMKLEDGAGTSEKDKKKSKKFKKEELEGGIAGGGEDGKKYKKEELKAIENNKKYKPEEINAGIAPTPSAPPAPPQIANNTMEEQGMKERKTNKKLKEYETGGANGGGNDKKGDGTGGKKDA